MYRRAIFRREEAVYDLHRFELSFIESWNEIKQQFRDSDFRCNLMESMQRIMMKGAYLTSLRKIILADQVGGLLLDTLITKWVFQFNEQQQIVTAHEVENFG